MRCWGNNRDGQLGNGTTSPLVSVLPEDQDADLLFRTSPSDLLQGVVAAEAIAGEETHPINYDMVPRATYCQPQVASFGYTEAQAKEKGFEGKVAKFPFAANGKAWGLGDATGFVKLVADSRYNEILGVHMIGPDVTELLPELTLAQAYDLTTDEVANNIHAHPTLSEALKEAAHGIGGHFINF